MTNLPADIEKAMELMEKLETKDVAKGKGFANWDFMADQIALALSQEREAVARELRKGLEVKFFKHKDGILEQFHKDLVEAFDSKLAELGISLK